MTTNQRPMILALFFISSLSALIYQVAWVRQATLVFGVSVYAYSAVLAAFMGGTALGSHLWSKRADQQRAPLRHYSILQVGIALLGILSPIALIALMPAYANLARTFQPGSPWITATRALFSILLLVPPTLLIGATLPLMARALINERQRNSHIGSGVGQLYAADTLGAAIGCALSGLFLLRTLGTQQTIFVAAALNLVAGLGAFYLSRNNSDNPPAKGKAVEMDDPYPRAFVPRFILWTYAISGGVALGYEVAWARILAVFTLDAIFSFSIMLTTFLAGLTLGGWIGARWVKNRVITPLNFGILQIGIGLGGLLTLYIFDRLPALSLEQVFGTYSIGNVILFELLLGFIALLLPTTLLGLLFPIAVSLYCQDDPGKVGARVGRLSALNTAGGVVGSLLTGFLLIPVMGLQATVGVLAGINLIMGLITTWIPSPQTGDRKADAKQHSRLLPQGGLALGIVMILLLPEGYYLGFRQGPSEHMAYYGEGVETTVAVFDVPEENFKVSFVNGRIEVPTDPVSMNAFRLLGHLPPLLRPNAERALMLSFGNGIATGSLDTHNIPHIEAVDLSAQQFEAAELYWEENYNVLRSPRLQTYVEDGRNFLLQTPHRYDIITTDATHPVNTSSWALFTQEFYQSVGDHLTDDGIFMQWLCWRRIIRRSYGLSSRSFPTRHSGTLAAVTRCC